MKKLYALLVAFLLPFGAMATQYCHTELKSGDNTVYLTCTNPSTGNYVILIEGEGLKGLGGSFATVDGVAGYQLSAEGHFALSADEKSIKCEITSTQAPELYTPLYVMMPGEVNFGDIKDIEWVADCGGAVVTPEPSTSAIDTIYMWNGSRGEKEATSATEIGGKAEVYLESGTNIVVGTKQKTNWTIKLNKGYKDAEQYSVIICLDKELAKGDMLTLGAFKTGTSAANLAIEYNADTTKLNQDVVTIDSVLRIVTTNVAPEDTVIPVPDAAAGMKFIRLYRKSGGTGIYISKFLITRAPQTTTEITAAPVPTWPENQVIALYSDAYTVNPTWNYLAGWGQTTQLEAKTVAEDNYLDYTNFNYLGWECNGAINALNMEKLHVDIWAKEDGTIDIVPIYGGAGLATDDNQIYTANLKANQWNQIDIDLATDLPNLNKSSIFQFKFKDGSVKEFAVDNVYFYRTTALVDTEAPTDVKAEVASASYFSVALALTADDNSGLVNFTVMNGEEVVATAGGAAKETVNVTVNNLKANTEYNFTVVATDANENKAEAVAVKATTLATPAAAPVPTIDAANVLSIYSDAYTFAPATLNSYNEGWWNAPKMAEGELAEGDKALYYYGFTDGMIGWQFAPINATDYKYFHIDIYPLAEGTVDLGPLNGGEGIETADYAIEKIALKANEWNAVEIDLTDKDLSSIFQVKLINYYALGSFFVDNVYLSKDQTVSGLVNVEGNNNSVKKVIENGILYIIRDGVRYNVMGTVVK